jgi:hypothetical protein
MRRRLEEIVKQSYKIVSEKINNGIVIVDVEAGLQLQYAYILKTIGALYEFAPNDRFSIELEKRMQFNAKMKKSGSKTAKIDIYMELENGNNKCRCAIELKFFKKGNHREPNNRYDMFQDLKNLETYKKNGIDLNYFIVMTDHEHYIEKENYSKDTKDFDMRDGKTYRKGTVLTYNALKSYEDIVLDNDYKFSWNKGKKYYSMLLEI